MAFALGEFPRSTDEQIIDLAVCHSNYKDTSKEGTEFEVFSHRRIVDFFRAIEGPLVDRIDELMQELRTPDKDRRQYFLTRTLYQNGSFNRSDLITSFGVSVPQASADIKRWLSEHPGAAVYNPSAKRYERAAEKAGV